VDHVEATDEVGFFDPVYCLQHCLMIVILFLKLMVVCWLLHELLAPLWMVRLWSCQLLYL
jgi:hypothetical protein